MSIAAEIIRMSDKLKTERSTTESHWQEIAEVLFPRQNQFFRQENVKGEKRTQKIIDPTAPMALERGASVIGSITTPHTTRWHGLRSVNPKLQSKEVQVYFDAATDVLFRLRYGGKAQFATQQHESDMSLMAFGTSVMAVEDMPGFGIRYKSQHIAEHFFMENIYGIIDTDYRRYKLTARQIRQKFPEAALPPALEKAVEKEPHKEFELVHCVMPNSERRYGVEGAQGFAFSSFYILMEGQVLLGTGGFRTFPYIVDRYVVAPNELYGRSPGMIALDEIKMLNEIRKTDLRARHLAVTPPWLAGDQNSSRRTNLTPNAINYGMLDANGNPLLKPAQSGARIDLSNDTISQSREIINDIFLVRLFQLLVDQPAMTATEVLERAREKGWLLSPVAARKQSYLSQMIERELDIAAVAGLLPPMPDELIEAEGEYEIEFTAPLNRMQKSEEALGAERVMQSVISLAGIYPDITDNVNPDEYVNVIKDANAAPAKMFRDDNEKAQLRDAKAQQAQMQQVMEAAPGVAGAVKDIAQAQAM